MHLSESWPPSSPSWLKAVSSRGVRSRAVTCTRVGPHDASFAEKQLNGGGTALAKEGAGKTAPYFYLTI